MTNKKTKLIIVESPSKARTLRKFLKDGYEIEASVGHIRDLAKKDLGVDIDNDFKANYIVSTDKKKVVKNLKDKLKNASELYLATDPDREGEAISWHIIEELKPKIPVKRLVFHEITKTAILTAFDHTRDIDTSLVNAQEARRILDRLFGYLVSKKLWLNVKGSLSAGRVQSPAVKLVVDKEKERALFKSREFWKIKGEFDSNNTSFEAELIQVDEKGIATGKDFEKRTGELKSSNKIALDEKLAKSLVDQFKKDKWEVSSVEQKPFTSNPMPPFITSTLQQDGVRKLRMSSKRVMMVAQKLYEAGLITYMRTDSTVLSGEAIKATRDEINNLYGADYLPEKPRQFKSKVKNAQEAHEAIRPAGSKFKNPNDLQNQLEADEWKLYDLIWKRTMASQMMPAKLLKTTAKISNGNAIFEAKGQVVEFPGYFKVYVKGTDGADADNKEKMLPELNSGLLYDDRQNIDANDFDAIQSITKATPRFTEATLIKELENLGIGRPSTYAAIMDKIQQRGYVRRVKGAMIPTFVAYAVIQFLEKYFEDLVNLQFTAGLEDTLDSISRAEKEATAFLNHFYFGEGAHKGLNDLLEQEFDKDISKTIIHYPKNGIPETQIKVGRYGVYIQQGDKRATLHEDVIPADFKTEHITEILSLKEKQPESMGDFNGEEVFLKRGRFGPYIQAGKKMKSLLPGMNEEDVTEEIAKAIISLPVDLGKHPETGESVIKDIGRYGPYVRSGRSNGSIPAEINLLEVNLEQAISFLKAKASGPKVLKELGKDADDKAIEVKDGRYGAYVTNGKINATIPKGTDPNSITLEQALEMIKVKIAKGPAKRRVKRKKSK